MQIILLPAGRPAALNLAQVQRFISSPSSTNSSDIELSGEEVYQTQTERPIRKRQRLHNMSEQEKQFRRKLKNRVAAQVARDKKKAKMDELEIVVEQLKLENQRLKAENERLLTENANLVCLDSNTQDVVIKSEERMYPVESAVLINGTLPQGKGYIQSIVLMTLLLILTLQSPAAQTLLNKQKITPVFGNQYPSVLRLGGNVMGKKQLPLVHLRRTLKHPP